MARSTRSWLTPQMMWGTFPRRHPRNEGNAMRETSTRRRERGNRTAAKPALALGAALAVALAGGALVAFPTASQAATLPPVATGDSRSVSEPHAPTTVCQTLGSGLTMA